MPKELEPSTNEKQFILESLSQGQRLDGRELDAFRPLELSFGEEYGLADVKLGKTRCAPLEDEQVIGRRNWNRTFKRRGEPER